ncbi:MAG TPA: hypothetical protein VHA30_00785, partial [Patescibacteria group bacterium]|nr:hypothetical protein [Patescibacteria group bacterium]
MVTREDLNSFIQNYKNGVKEVLDEQGQKIPVHIADYGTGTAVVPLVKSSVAELGVGSAALTEAAGPAPAAAAVFSNMDSEEEAEAGAKMSVVSDLDSSLRLSRLSNEVFKNLENRVKNLSDNVYQVERELSKMQPPAPAVPVLPASSILEPAAGGFQKNNFASNFELSAGTESNEKQTAGLSPAVLKKLYASFTASFAKKSLVLPGILLTVCGVTAAVILSLLLTQNELGQRPELTEVVYKNGETAALSVGTTTPIYVTGQGGSQVINQLLGMSQSEVLAAIDQRLNQYLAEGKFKGMPGEQGKQGPAGIQGPQGPAGASGTQGGVAVIPSVPSNNFAGATVFSATEVSGQNASFNNLSVSNNSQFSGAVAFNGSVSFNNGAAISDLNVNSLNLGFTQGSIVFQGPNGLAQDNANFVYSASTTQLALGTSSPDSSAVLDLSSSDKGFLAPRLSQAQRDGIVSPANGLLIYNTDTTEFNVYNGSFWVPVGSGGGGGNGSVATGTPGSFAFYSGPNLINSQNLLFLSANKLGVGTSTPTSEFAIQATGSPQSLFTVASSSGASLLIVTNAGWLGIGTSTPAAQLAVSGNGLLTGNLTVNGTGLFATVTASSLTVSGSTTIGSLGTGVVRSAGGSLFTGGVDLGSSDVSGVLAPANGGTGTSTLPASDALLIGNGSGYQFASLTACDPATQKLVYATSTKTFSCAADQGIQNLNGLTAASQSFATGTDVNLGLTIVSTGATHLFTPTWNGQLSVARGGTGISSVVPGALLYGNGTAALNQTNAPAAGQLLVGTASSTPGFVTMSGDAGLSSSGVLSLATVNANSGTFGSASTVPIFSVNAKGLITAVATTTVSLDASALVSGTLPYARGGTGQTSYTTNGVLYAGAGALQSTAAGTAFQVLRSNGSGSAPSYSDI